MLARYMDESRSIPTATSFRTITVTRAGRRAASSSRTAGQKVSFTHLIAYAIAQAATRRHAGDGPPLRRDRRQAASASTTAQVNLGIAVDVEKKDGTRTLMVPVIRDAGR